MKSDAEAVYDRALEETLQWCRILERAKRSGSPGQATIQRRYDIACGVLDLACTKYWNELAERDARRQQETNQ